MTAGVLKVSYFGGVLEFENRLVSSRRAESRSPGDSCAKASVRERSLMASTNGSDQCAECNEMRERLPSLIRS